MPGGYHTWIDTYGCRCEEEAHVEITIYSSHREPVSLFARLFREPTTIA
jgi:hypothetical protein